MQPICCFHGDLLTIGIDMTIQEIITIMTNLSKKAGASHLSLFGSYAKGTATKRSDVDFIVYGCPDIEKLKEDAEQIPTLRKIDLFDYDEVCNPMLREEMDKYGKIIY